ncbi:uncharacterized protein BJ212DRAFT_1486505 [Suillus subaureus]|uniref:F-box domain-containing protein n=1 Tax=Suillus subaureus TaxID=48587 RepID=A0A9P7DXD5_9AGAM|nr:uncharacterized protein BJ212DRAFT_1486505 [Suillus subaureus]KAG1805206.1 hypothetical protein BJ212DRAFT_1486505 [Suillus subaureus]
MVLSHRALYISEILLEISYQLEDDRKSLSRLARCCKAFSDPALDVLWRRMSLFSPFIPLLPPEVLTLWVRIILGQVEYQFSAECIRGFQCPPMHEWKAFDAYARRVRILYSGASHFLAGVATIRADFNVFPFLRSMSMQLQEPIQPEIRLFPETLQTLEISGPAYINCKDSCIQTALAHAARDAPSLKHLHVEDYSYNSDRLDTPPLHFKHLQSVEISAFISSNVLRSLCCVLSHSPVIELKIELPPTSCIWDTPQSLFPYLERVEIHGTPALAEAFITNISSSCVRSLTVRHSRGPARLADCSLLFSTIVNKCGSSLQSLSLTISRSPVLHNHDGMAHDIMDALFPLMPNFEHLEELHLSLPSATQVDDYPAVEASGWPALRRVEFMAT